MIAATLGSAVSALQAQDCVWTEALRPVVARVHEGDQLSGGEAPVPDRTATDRFCTARSPCAGIAPGGLAADSSGLLYTTHPEGGYVDVRDPRGEIVSKREGFMRPFAIALDVTGRVYVGEQTAGRVGVFDAAWNRQFYLGQGDGEFVNPTGIAVDPEGAGWIYVTDGATHQVRVYDGAGTFIFAFGGKGSAPGRFDFPAGIHLRPARGSVPTRLFVSDQNNDRVQILDDRGNFVSCIGGDGGTRRFGRITGLVSDRAGRLFVADSFQGQVWVFDRNGALLDRVGEFGSAPGRLMTPLGLTIVDRRRIGAVGSSKLYVASFNTGRVEEFGLSSEVSALERRAEKDGRR